MDAAGVEFTCTGMADVTSFHFLRITVDEKIKQLKEQFSARFHEQLATINALRSEIDEQHRAVSHICHSMNLLSDTTISMSGSQPHHASYSAGSTVEDVRPALAAACHGKLASLQDSHMQAMYDREVSPRQAAAPDAASAHMCNDLLAHQYVQGLQLKAMQLQICELQDDMLRSAACSRELHGKEPPRQPARPFPAGPLRTAEQGLTPSPACHRSWRSEDEACPWARAARTASPSAGRSEEPPGRSAKLFSAGPAHKAERPPPRPSSTDGFGSVASAEVPLIAKGVARDRSRPGLEACRGDAVPGQRPQPRPETSRADRVPGHPLHDDGLRPGSARSTLSSSTAVPQFSQHIRFQAYGVSLERPPGVSDLCMGPPQAHARHRHSALSSSATDPLSSHPSSAGVPSI